MRKMYSEKQVEELAKKKVQEMIESGQISLGTKLYQHSLEVTGYDSDGGELHHNMIIISRIKDSFSTGEDGTSPDVLYDTLIDTSNISARVESSNGWEIIVGISYDSQYDEVDVSYINALNGQVSGYVLASGEDTPRVDIVDTVTAI